MIKFEINGMEIETKEGSTILDVCQFYGIEIPTLCHRDGLEPYGSCRLCLVEIGEAEKSQLVSACTYLVQEGLKVRTNTSRVIQTRKMMIELLLSICPSSKTIQDLASKFNVRRVRFDVRYEDCILCGLCIRMCKEQMQAAAIGFSKRGFQRKITTPFNIKSDVCRFCGGCIYICPACQLRCQGPDASTDICNACLSLEPTCINNHDDYQCWMATTGSCGTCEGRSEQTTNSLSNSKHLPSNKLKGE